MLRSSKILYKRTESAVCVISVSFSQREYDMEVVLAIEVKRLGKVH